MANSLLTYVKENPIQSALTVASVVPAVRVASLLHKGYKAYKARPVTIYRGISDKKLSLKDTKLALAKSKYEFKNEPKGKLSHLAIGLQQIYLKLRERLHKAELC